MEVVPDTKYAIKKMLSKYFIVYILLVISFIIAAFLFFRPMVFFLINNFSELFINHSAMSGYVKNDIIHTILLLFALPIIIPLMLFLFEFYLLKVGKIKIILGKDGLMICTGTLIRKVKWDEYSAIITTSVPSRIKVDTYKNLVLPYLFDRQKIQKTIDLYKKNM